MNNTSIPMFLLIFWCVGGVGSSETKQDQEEIYVCDPPVSEAVKAANASFNLVFTFLLDKEGRPVHIRPAGASPFVDSTDDVVACLSLWRPRPKKGHVIFPV